MKFEGNSWPQRLPNPTLLELWWWLIGVGCDCGRRGDILEGQALQARWSEPWIYVLLRQLCRWLCVCLSVCVRTLDIEERNKIKEGNEIYCLFALRDGSRSCMESDESLVWIKCTCVARASAKDNIPYSWERVWDICTSLKTMMLQPR